MIQNELLVSIAEKHNKSVAQVVYERGLVSILKSDRMERMVKNFNIFDVELSQDIDAIATLDTKESLFFSQRDTVGYKRLVQPNLILNTLRNKRKIVTRLPYTFGAAYLFVN
jgi:2,5-diketo-D-gluconate reductase A